MFLSKLYQNLLERIEKIIRIRNLNWFFHQFRMLDVIEKLWLQKYFECTTCIVNALGILSNCTYLTFCISGYSFIASEAYRKRHLKKKDFCPHPRSWSNTKNSEVAEVLKIWGATSNTRSHFLYRFLDGKKTTRSQFSVPGLQEIHRNLKQEKN